MGKSTFTRVSVLVSIKDCMWSLLNQFVLYCQHVVERNDGAEVSAGEATTFPVAMWQQSSSF